MNTIDGEAKYESRNEAKRHVQDYRRLPTRLCRVFTRKFSFSDSISNVKRQVLKDAS